MRIKIITLLILSFLLFSCNPEKKYSKSDIIPPDKLISILVDMYKADGILTVYRIRKEFANVDKKQVYDDICKKHNTTREKLDLSIEYYSNNLEKFEEINDKVIEELSKLEYPAHTKTDSLTNKTLSTENLWNQKDNWYLPEDGQEQQIPFSVQVKEPGRYTIKAKIKLYNDDQSLNPKIYAYFWYDNGTPDGYRDYFEMPLKKTNTTEEYSISKRLQDDNVTHLRGWILYHDEQEGSWQKHAEVSNINIVYSKDRRR